MRIVFFQSVLFQLLNNFGPSINISNDPINSKMDPIFTFSKMVSSQYGKTKQTRKAVHSSCDSNDQSQTDYGKTFYFPSPYHQKNRCKKLQEWELRFVKTLPKLTSGLTTPQQKHSRNAETGSWPELISMNPYLSTSTSSSKKSERRLEWEIHSLVIKIMNWEDDLL